ncbi:iron chelate uptake ABC transporter family permease subunit [Hamadaea sp. NPDC051192]|uniref:FecCD family ABC transporter permease n=1 Tax=Hamadaea sp. NPDC051192 TaxID=3154940 RepID=UPI003448B78C
MTVLRAATVSVRLRPRSVVAGFAVLAVALGCALLLLSTGDYPLSPDAALKAVLGSGTPADAYIVQELRAPRVVTALLAGAALALAGAIFQALTRNPLGSPDVLGFTQGSAAGALVAIVVTGGGSLTLAAGALVGGIVTGAAIYLLAVRHGSHGSHLVLVGIGVAAVLTGVNGYLFTRAEITDASRAMLWLTGSLDGRGWEDALPLLAVLAVVVPIVLFGLSRPLSALALGDDQALALGVRVTPVRVSLLAAAVLLCSAAAAAAGPVSFVALTAPQVARRITGDPGPNLLSSVLVGAALMTAADLAAQRLVPGRDLPVGVLTGILGGAYLVWLLAARRRSSLGGRS